MLFISKFKKLNIFAKDGYTGDTILHMACKNRNLELIKVLFEMDSEKCLMQNYSGQTPVYLATKAEDTRILDVF
jgi:ankyrin repeat protein